MAKTSKNNTPAPIKVFSVEDHPTFRKGLAEILRGERDLKVCGHAGTATEALRSIARLRPDLVLVDITLPGKSGLDLIKELRARDGAIKILVLSMHDEAIYATRVLRAGGNGYIMKQEDPEEIIRAVRDVLQGHIYVSERVLASLPRPSAKHGSGANRRRLDDLTDQELEILEWLGQGKTSRQIAREHPLVFRSVVASCARMRKKLKLRSLNELVRYAVSWVETGES